MKRQLVSDKLRFLWMYVLPHLECVLICCRYVRFWDAFDPESCVVQAAAVTEGLVCRYSSDGAVLAVGLVETVVSTVVYIFHTSS